MTAREISENELLDAVLNSRLRSVHTALPGTIRAYTPDSGNARGTATVELAVELEGPGGAFEAVSRLEIPVTHPGAWADGDRCLVVFCEEDFSKWLSTGSVEPPAVLDRHGLHGVCIPWVEGASQFVALANLVDAALGVLRDAIAAAAQVETSASGLGGMTALAGALTIVPGPPPQLPSAWPMGSVAAEKVRAV